MKGHDEGPFPVVGIGASAGGLGALTHLIGALPPRPGLALVVVQHLDPHHESRLASLLQSHTSMDVTDVTHGTRIAPDHVYVIQPNTDVAIADGVLEVSPRPDDRRPHYPVDHFLRSLAAVRGPHAIGVILSGTGSDGTLGICEIKAAGGVTFAQDEASAQHAGMPHSAAASGAVDLVLAPNEIATHLSSLASHPYLARREMTDEDAPDEEREPQGEDEHFHRVIAALRNTSGVDFSQYRDTTIKRRTARRMLLRGFRSPHQYAQFLENDPAEAEALYRDVLINVTSFFRDRAMFEDLKQQVFPAIVKASAGPAPVRIWVPGCSTGQEAYSLAMVLREYLDSIDSTRTMQIFATDLGDPQALEKARAGVYPESIEAEVSPERLRRFFTKHDRTYRINKAIRDVCVFARQNVTVDPPFSRVDLITCRNVLIYMSPALQDRLLPVFHFALNPGGYLVLGLAETIGPFGDLFELVNRSHKIYRKKHSNTRPQLTFMADAWLTGLPLKRTATAAQPQADVQREADRLALDRYAPPSVLVNHEFEVLQYRGRTAPFLEAPAGLPTTSLLRMAREGLFTELRSALAEAKSASAQVVREGLRVHHGGADVEFTLRILPVNPGGSEPFCLLVVFEPTGQPVWTGPVGVPADPQSIASRDLDWLRQELVSSRQYLQSVVDQQEAATQELRAAHEEVLSSNEELQSTNEELETTKEELQSANEELTTVNEQFESRNHELDALTDDLSNFISSAGLPMVTVGRDLCVRRLTPAAQATFNLLPSDVGRSLEHIKFSLAIDHIGEVIEQVIASVQPWEREVTDREGRWWLLRVRPFRTGDDRIDGATIVAIDIDLARRSHELLEARDYALAIVQTVREPLVVLDAECRVELANEAFYRLFDASPDATEGRLMWQAARGGWVDIELQRALLTACQGKRTIDDLEVERILPDRGPRTLVLNARAIVRSDRPTLLLLAIEDVTATRQAEALRIDAESLRQLDRRKDEFLGILAHELRNPLAPMRFALEVLRRGEDRPGDITRARQVLERQVGHMVRIVDDLLDVSRITQGKVELRREHLPLSRLVSTAVELSKPAVAAARHTLTVSLPDEEVILDADPVRIAQVVVNLLNNAVKFTEPGGHIWLIAETTGEPGDPPNQVSIRVRDTGIGITAEALPTIFDLFWQGDLSLERTRAGLGVGLTLVRNLVALHGGSVDVRSAGPGAGSEFTVRLPLDPAHQEAPASDAAPARLERARALKILVADDNHDGREMLTFLLRGDGHTVVAAEDGTAALRGAEQLHPDVAILDIGMPGANGYTVAQTLRERANGAPLALIALSGLGQPEDKSRAGASGFDQHFTKPVDVNALRAFLDTVEPATETADSPAADDTSSRASS